MFYLTQGQASILVLDFSYLDTRQNQTVSSQLQYIKQQPWNSTILNIDGGCVVKMYWDFHNNKGFFLSGLDDDKEVYYEHLGILEDVYASEIAIVDDGIEWGIDPEVFAEIYSKRIANI